MDTSEGPYGRSGKMMLVSINLFSLYAVFSQYRPCDNTLENRFFQITSNSRAYLHIIYEETKGQVPGTLPEKKKQNKKNKKKHVS